MSYDEKLDEILSRLSAIEAKLNAGSVEMPSDGLYWYKRPTAGVPRYGYGVRLTPDTVTPEELRLRALYCVRWNGEIARTGPYEDEVWAEIAALQAGDPGLIERYKMLDPDLVGYCLLTAKFDPVKYDNNFGVNIGKRQGYAGKTLESEAEELRILLGGNPRPSGGEIGE